MFFAIKRILQILTDDPLINFYYRGNKYFYEIPQFSFVCIILINNFATTIIKIIDSLSLAPQCAATRLYSKPATPDLRPAL